MSLNPNHIDNSSNGSLSVVTPLYLRICDSSVFFLIWLLTLISFSIILFLFYRTSSLREVSGYLMVKISVIDFMTSQIIILPSVYSLAVGEVPWDGTLLCTGQAFCNVYLQNLKALTITLCALDRAFSINRPFEYASVANQKNFLIAVAIVSPLASVIPTLQFGPLGWNAIGDDNSGICWPVPASDEFLAMYYTSMFVTAILPGIIVILCYGAIMHVVFRQRVNIHKQTQQQSTSLQSNNGGGNQPSDGSGRLSLFSHLAACKMLFIVTLLYFLSFVPIVIADHYFQDLQVPYHFCNYLAYCSTFTNCIIYYKMNGNFKKAFQKANIHRCCIEEKRSTLLDDEIKPRTVTANA